MSGSDIKARTELFTALQEYIDKRFMKIDKARCLELTIVYRASLELSRLNVYRSRFLLSDSYNDVRESFVGIGCKERFCEQLSDQLVFCEECDQKPILYNVIRDKDSVKRHLRDHSRRSQVQIEEIENIRRMLFDKLTCSSSQLSEKGSDRKNM